MNLAALPTLVTLTLALAFNASAAGVPSSISNSGPTATGDETSAEVGLSTPTPGRPPLVTDPPPLVVLVVLNGDDTLCRCGDEAASKDDPFPVYFSFLYTAFLPPFRSFVSLESGLKLFKFGLLDDANAIEYKFGGDSGRNDNDEFW